ncbi:MAG: divalent-cation tolerance protein CutA [Alphaproteobacteria bacterium]|nr:divalent-cation tolerance protein CutA [Alphaproteobacteria bacterium]
MTDFRLVYSTFSHREEAISVARKLLKERLIACANVTAAGDSLYRWEGKIESASEAVLLAKTTTSSVQKTIARIKELHSYELPCIITMPIESGFAPFLSWIEQETI